MASTEFLDLLQASMSYKFNDTSLLARCLVAGDIDSPDREGNRGVAQLGDSLMATVILDDGLARGRSREDLQNMCSKIRSKCLCGRVARDLRLHEHIKISGRQSQTGCQPKTLKCAVAALIGAVWQDSRNYQLLLRVMESIGLLNHALNFEPAPDLYPVDAQSVELGSEVRMLSWDAALPNDSNIDHDYFSSLPETDLQLDDLFDGALEAPGLFDDLFNEPLGASHPFAAWQGQESELAVSAELDESAETAVSAGALVLETSASTVYDGNTQTRTPPLTIAGSESNGSPPASACSNLTSTTIASPEDHSQSPPARKKNRSEATRLKVVHAFIANARNQASSTEEDEHLTQVAETYASVFLQASSQRAQTDLAMLAASIGDPSALRCLKEAIHGLRAIDITASLCVDQEMSLEDRLRMIRGLEAMGSLSRLVRWLHIVKLHDDLTRNASVGSDRFINQTKQGFSNNPSLPGNPFHRARAQVSQGFRGLASSATQSDTATKREITKLRRIGERLSAIAQAWGLGSILLLGFHFSDDRIMSASNDLFREFISVVNRCEGDEIRSISAAANVILHHLCCGTPPSVRVRLESVAHDDLEKVARLSPGCEFLFAPLE